jgi:hypothetical protein
LGGLAPVSVIIAPIFNKGDEEFTKDPLISVGCKIVLIWAK